MGHSIEKNWSCTFKIWRCYGKRGNSQWKWFQEIQDYFEYLKVNIAKPPDERVSADQSDFLETLGNGEKIKCDIETVQGRLTATNVFKADGSFILMPHNRVYNHKSPMMPHGNRHGRKLHSSMVDTVWYLTVFYMILKYSPPDKRPLNSSFTANKKWKRYMKNPRRFPDDSEQQRAVGTSQWFKQSQLDAANKRRNRK